MSARCRACLSVLTLSGCFNDPGAGTTASTPAATTSDDSAATTTTTVGPTPTTSEAGSTTTTTTPTTTSVADTGTAEVTTGDATTGGGACSEPMACTPDSVMEVGTLCDPCGRVRRTCTAGCTWGPEQCVEDLSSCVYWTYDALGEASWKRVALPLPPPDHAPTGPVIAAVDLRADGRAVALTVDRYHVLDGPSGTWAVSGPLSDFLPGLPGPVLQAYAVYDPLVNMYSVTAVGDPTAWLYTMPVGTIAATFAGEGSCCGSFTQAVQPPSLAAVRDIFIDIDPPFPWIPGDLPACNEDGYFLTRYAGWATTDSMYVQDVGLCFTMEYSQTLAQFPPFAAPGAPPGALIGGLALLDERLYVFAGG